MLILISNLFNKTKQHSEFIKSFSSAFLDFCPRLIRSRYFRIIHHESYMLGFLKEVLASIFSFNYQRYRMWCWWGLFISRKYFQYRQRLPMVDLIAIRESPQRSPMKWYMHSVDWDILIDMTNKEHFMSFKTTNVKSSISILFKMSYWGRNFYRQFFSN